MRINCRQCQAVYSIDDSLCHCRRLKVRCPACGNIQEINNLQKTQPRVGTENGDTKQSVGSFVQQKEVDGKVGVTDGADEGEQVCCQSCGVAIELENQLGAFCRKCSELESSKEPSAEKIWRLKKADGLEVGPLSLVEVKQKIGQNEITRNDFLAKGDSEYLSIEHWAGLEPFTLKSRQTAVMPSNQSLELEKEVPRSKTTFTVYVGFILAGLGVAIVVWYFWFNQPKQQGKPTKEDAVSKILEGFAEEIKAPEGTCQEMLKIGREKMLLDNRDAYLQADRAFKSALILDVDNYEACAGWVQNRALMDRGEGNVTTRKLAMDLIEHALRRKPHNPLLYRAKAFLMFSLGQIAQARKLAQKALEKIPKDPETQLVLGATYLSSQSDEAIALIQAALDSNPGFNIAYRLLGEAHVHQGMFRKAVDFLKSRLKEQPGHLETLEALARIYLEIGELKQAEKTYQEILAIDSYNVQTLVHLARLYVQLLGRPEEAVSMIGRTLKEADKEAEHLSPSERSQLFCELSAGYRVLGLAQKAMDAATQALREDPYSVLALFSRAVAEQDVGQVVVALSHFQELRSHLPNSARIRASIAELQMLIPDFDKALRELKYAIQLDPNDMDILLMRAVLHVFLDNKPNALTWLKEALLIDPFAREAYTGLEAYYEGSSSLRFTIERATQAASEYDEDVLAQRLLGIVLFRAGKWNMARKVLTRVLQIDKDCFQANLFLGLLNLTQGRYSKAVFFLHAAHRGDASHLNTAKALAQAYLKKGWIKKADRILHRVLEVAPKDIGARLGLVEILLAKNKRTEAVANLVKVYQTDKNNRIAKRLLFQVGY